MPRQRGVCRARRLSRRKMTSPFPRIVRVGQTLDVGVSYPRSVSEGPVRGRPACTWPVSELMRRVSAARHSLDSKPEREAGLEPLFTVFTMGFDLPLLSSLYERSVIQSEVPLRRWRMAQAALRHRSP